MTQLATLFILLSNLIHPFHVSVCEVVYDSNQQTLEITHKFFVDDLEEALNKHFSSTLDLLQHPEQTDDYLKPYLQSKFKIEINNVPMDFIYLGSEFEEDALRCYIEVKNVPDVSETVIMNKALLDTFDDQQNLVHVRVSGKVKSILISRDQPSGKVSFVD